LLYADIDLQKCVELKQLHDISGGYNRFDIFQLKVNRAAQRPIEFETEPLPSDSRESGKQNP
jgi:aliphatic nitrilase